MKRPLFAVLLLLLLCALTVVSAASSAFSAKPTPDKRIPVEAEAVLHRLKQSCSTSCVENKHQIKIEKAKGNLDEVVCKNFCRFIFYTFKNNQDELFSLAKSDKLDAIDLAMKDVMVLKYGNNKQHEVSALFMDKLKKYANIPDKKDEL